MDNKKDRSQKQKQPRKMTKQRRIAVLRFRAALLVVVIGVLAFCINRYVPTSARADLHSYYGKVGEGEAAVILGSQIMDVRGKTDSGKYYLPYSFVTTFLNPGFYWDADNNQILYTTPSRINTTDIGNEAGGDVILQDGTIYLSLDLIRDHTDLDVTIYSDPDRIAIQKDFRDLNMARTMSKGNIRLLGGIKSKVLTEVESGTDLIYLDEIDEWSHVATWDGYIGYIESRKLNPVETVTLERESAGEKYSYIQMSAPVNLIWHVIGQQESNDLLLQDVAAVTGVNVISPTWFSVLNNDGEIQDLSSSEYVENAHSLGMQVWGLIDNFGTGFTSYEVLSHTDSRQNLIRNIMDAALNAGMDGINVDFETLTPETIPHFLEFLRELSVQTHENGLILSMDDPVPETYSSFYRRDLQAQVVDYIIIMGYDEHYSGSETAGSVASMPWVEKGIIDTIRETPASRTILAVPFYTRIWKTQAGTLSSLAVGMRAGAEEAAAAEVSYWNTDTMQNYAQWEQDGVKYQVWLEDLNSLRERMKLIRQYHLAGVASWRLGFEIPEVWAVISEEIAQLAS